MRNSSNTTLEVYLMPLNGNFHFFKNSSYLGPQIVKLREHPSDFSLKRLTKGCCHLKGVLFWNSKLFWYYHAYALWQKITKTSFFLNYKHVVLNLKTVKLSKGKKKLYSKESYDYQLRHAFYLVFIVRRKFQAHEKQALTI